MKQRKPLQRRTGLRATAGLSRSTRLASSGPVKARGRIGLTKAERDVKDIVIARAGGLCELCGQAEGGDFSHRWAEGQGGPYLPSNGLLACRRDHDWLHDNPTEAKAHGWFIPPTYRMTPGGPREPILASEVPAYIFCAGGWQREWMLLNDLGGVTPVGYDELHGLLAEFDLGRVA